MLSLFSFALLLYIASAVTWLVTEQRKSAQRRAVWAEAIAKRTVADTVAVARAVLIDPDGEQRESTVRTQLVEGVQVPPRRTRPRHALPGVWYDLTGKDLDGRWTYVRHVEKKPAAGGLTTN